MSSAADATAPTVVWRRSARALLNQRRASLFGRSRARGGRRHRPGRPGRPARPGRGRRGPGRPATGCVAGRAGDRPGSRGRRAGAGSDRSRAAAVPRGLASPGSSRWGVTHRNGGAAVSSRWRLRDGRRPARWASTALATWRPSSAALSAVSTGWTRFPIANTPALLVRSPTSTTGPRVAASRSSPPRRTSSWSGIQSPVVTTVSHRTRVRAPVRGPPPHRLDPLAAVDADHPRARSSPACAGRPGRTAGTPRTPRRGCTSTSSRPCDSPPRAASARQTS